MHYLKQDQNLGPTYNFKTQRKLIGYADTDWEECHKSSCSTFRYIFTCADAAISWASKKQTAIALFTAEAKYTALCVPTQKEVHVCTRSQAKINNLFYIRRCQKSDIKYSITIVFPFDKILCTRVV